MKAMEKTFRTAVEEFNKAFVQRGLKPVFDLDMMYAAYEELLDGSGEGIFPNEYEDSLMIKVAEVEVDGFYGYPVYASWLRFEGDTSMMISRLIACTPKLKTDPHDNVITIHGPIDEFAEVMRRKQKVGRGRSGLMDI
jgi:hypothetical protein